MRWLSHQLVRVEAAGVEVSDENTNKEYEGVSARMMGLVEQYKYKFDNLSWEYQKILSEIPDPEETSGQNFEDQFA